MDDANERGDGGAKGSRNRTIAAVFVLSTSISACISLILTAVPQNHLLQRVESTPATGSPKLHRRDASFVIWPLQSPLIHPLRRVSLTQSPKTSHTTTLTQPTLHHGRRLSCSHCQQGLMGFFPQGIQHPLVVSLSRLCPLTRNTVDSLFQWRPFVSYRSRLHSVDNIAHRVLGILG